MSKVIMGIEVGTRIDDAAKIQQLLTEKGCVIKTRLGLHETDTKGEFCSKQGLIIIEFINDVDKDIKELESELDKLESVTVKKMVF